MLKITKRDLLTAGGVAVLLVVLIIGARDKVKQVPRDNRHLVFYEAMNQGRDRAGVEKGCVLCHNPQSRPLPPQHPPKEQCLLCHKLAYARK
jgi:hypothetical protein